MKQGKKDTSFSITYDRDKKLPQTYIQVALPDRLLTRIRADLGPNFFGNMKAAEICKVAVLALVEYNQAVEREAAAEKKRREIIIPGMVM